MIKRTAGLFTLLSIVVCCASVFAGADNMLFRYGQSDYSISVGVNASSDEYAAAIILQDYLHEVSSSYFPIVKEKAGKSITLNIVKADNAKDFLNSDDSFSIISDNADINIVGKNAKSLLYAVYAFLEESFECKWYTSKVKKIPTVKKYSFDKIEIIESPQVPFRSVDYVDVWEPEMAVPNRNNCQFHGPQKTTMIDMLWLEHSFDIFVPTAQYFKTHPEYYTYYDGKRHDVRNQLCLSNKDVLDITIRELRKYIIAHPEFKIYNVGQNDNQNYCRCDECAKIAKKYGGESGIMIWFVNQAADAVRDEFPDKYIGTFAYQYTRKPPINIKPRENVAIILCTIECDFSHPFTHEHNTKFLDDLDNWKQITRNILIWDYVVNYRHYLIPHPNFNILQENIQILRDAGVLGILEQADGHSACTEFFGLRAYLLTKLLWNPDCDTREIIEDYIANYYGDSAAYILKYFDLSQSLVKEDTFLSFANRSTNPIYTAEFINEADALLKKAIRSANNDEILRRVEIVKLQITYLKLVTGLVEYDSDKLLGEFIEITEREGITWSSEGLSSRDFVKKYKEVLAEALKKAKD